MPEGVINVSITKGKGTLALDVNALPQHVFEALLVEGAKAYANRGMSKITKSLYSDPEELKAAAMAQAEKNIKAMQDGTIRIVGAPKQAKASGAVMTEARRIALNIVKQTIKDAGEKISHYDRKDLTAAAAEMLNGEDGPGIIEMAKKSLEERAAVKPKFNITAHVKVSPTAVARAENKKAAAKADTSAAQAGRVVPRARGEAPSARH